MRPHLYAAIETNPMWMVVAAIVGGLVTLATQYKPNKTSEAQVVIDGLTTLVTNLQTEVARLTTRVAVHGARIFLLESKLREANLPVPGDQIWTPTPPGGGG